MASVRAVEKNGDVDIISIKNPPDEPGMAYRIFCQLAESGVDVDLILQTASQNRSADIIFTVHKNCTDTAESELRQAFYEYPRTEISVNRDAVKLTVSGDGMQGRVGVAAEVFRCLWGAGVHIINISTSEIKISLLVPKSEGERAFSALTETLEFEL